MFTLPQLIEEDIFAFDAALGDFISRSEARAAIIIDRGGFIITRRGDVGDLDMVTLGALAANSFAATEAIAGIISETNVNSLYQEGERNSLLILSIDPYGFLVVVFPASLGVGSIKYYTIGILDLLRGQFDAAGERAPGAGLDLSELNMADSAPMFQRK